MPEIKEFFDLAGSLICHQLPSRSLSAGGMQLPVCARDMGIYAGIFTAMLFLLPMRRLRAQKPPGIVPAVFMCMLMLPMVLDGLLSYTGIINTNNTTRLLTGALFGLPIPIFLVPAARFRVDGANVRPVLKHPAELVPAYVFLLVLCDLFLNGLVPYVVAGLIYVSGLLFLLGRLVFTIFARIGRFRSVPLHVATVGVTLGVIAGLYLLSAFVLQPLKIYLLGG